MNRVAAYQQLVNLRKKHKFPAGLLNPYEIEDGRFDSEHLGPWARWQGDLNAEVLVVGQDWGSKDYFLDFKGFDDDKEPTCTNLRALAAAGGWDLGLPRAPVPQPLYFTNAVLGIRAAKGKTGIPPKPWVDDSVPFLLDLLKIVQPKVVVSLGIAAYRACRFTMIGTGRDAQLPLGSTLKNVFAQNPILRPITPAWFALYHCSPGSIGRNRSMDLQLEDWRLMGNWFRNNRR